MCVNFCFVLFCFFSFFVSLLEVLFQFLSGVLFSFVEKAFLFCAPPTPQSLPAQFLLFPVLHFFFGFVLVFAIFLFLGLLPECLVVFLCRYVGMGTPYSWASITRISSRNIGQL